MRKNNWLMVLSFTFVFMACEKFELSTKEDTFFHVHENGADLPVLVRGNTASKKLMIFINGGPGLTSLDVAQADMFEWKNSLEKEFAVVYYDQRGCGNAQGNIDESTINIAQYVEDLDAIISVLKAKYDDADVFLLGHSFGSFIGTSYLLNPAYEERIKGWISLDGAYNFDYELSWQYRRTFLINIANEEIGKGKDEAHWQEALDWCADNPEITEREQKNEWREFIGDPGESIVPEELPSLSLGQYLGIGFASSYNPIPSYASGNLERVNDLLNNEVEGINLMTEVSNITLPTRFIWGRYDDVIVPEEGRDVFNAFGTDSLSKAFILIPNASHEPMFSNPKALEKAISTFIAEH